VTAQGSAHMRLRRALDGGNVTEALSAAAELDFVSLAKALELAAGIEIWVAMAAGRIEALLGQQTRDRFWPLRAMRLRIAHTHLFAGPARRRTVRMPDPGRSLGVGLGRVESEGRLGSLPGFVGGRRMRFNSLSRLLDRG